MIRNLIIEQLKKSAEVKLKVAELEADAIAVACEMLVRTFQEGGKVLLIGNGGSAADAQHIAGEWTAQFKMKRRALPALALTTNTSILTSIVNDDRNNTEFARQVEAFANHPSDLLIAITTSGNSPNILEAVKCARNNHIRVIGLTGNNGGKLKDMVDLAIIVPSNDTQRIQESHIAIGHVICDIVEQKLFWLEEHASQNLKTSPGIFTS